MEDIIQVVVNNGLGVASFLALIYFYFNFVNKINDTNQINIRYSRYNWRGSKLKVMYEEIQYKEEVQKHLKELDSKLMELSKKDEE